VIIVTNNFWSLKLVTNEAFSYSDIKLSKLKCELMRVFTMQRHYTRLIINMNL